MYQSTETNDRQPRAIARLAAAFLLAVVAVVALCSVPSTASAAVTDPTFPRLALWWPDNHAQSATARARYDWVALQSYDADHIAELRAANPSIIVLGSTSARELNYVLGDYNNSRNVELRSASTDWMLTQVGSTLTAGITASATSIPVADVTRFAVGEMALIDHELVHIEAVGVSALTVTRGPVNPAAAHAAGARIASVVSAWPGAVTFDVTTNCPKADVGHGLETWNQWNTRRGQAVLTSADWDGLLIDCLEGNPSWMATEGTNRSIDALRTNKPVTDNYAAFNAAWNAGAEAYGDALKAAAGSKLLIGNGNMRNYSLNGNVFEDFPRADLTPSLWNTVFVGPYSYPRASYPEWCASAAGPNLTLIQVYGAHTDYKLMRFGLTSALMDNGYFSYALSGSGHSVNGLDWFDEYDNAGAGRGYLGQPLGAKVKAGNAWRRDYEGGIALVNPTASPVTVSLGGAFRKIDGTQDRTVNDGTTVTSVTIPARDGIVLLRIAAPTPLPTPTPTPTPVPTTTPAPVPSPTPAPAPATTAALRASSTTLTYGTSTTLRITVAPAASTAVTIEMRAAGSSQWERLADLRTDAGSASLTIRPLANTEYRALVGDTTSPSVTVQVKAQATAKSSRQSVRRRNSLTISGTVTTALRSTAGVASAVDATATGTIAADGPRAVLQRRVNHKWVTVKAISMDATGRYSVKARPRARGTYSFRVLVSECRANAASASRTIKVRVR